MILNKASIIGADSADERAVVAAPLVGHEARILEVCLFSLDWKDTDFPNLLAAPKIHADKSIR